MPPKRPSRKSIAAQSKSSSRRCRNEVAAAGADDDYGANDVSMMEGDMDLNDGDAESGTESNANDLRDLEESLKMSMVVDTGLRKEQRQRHLETDFENQVCVVQEKIEERSERRKREVDHIQDDFLTRLLTLSRRKSELETQIIKETQELADAYLGLKEEFEAVLQGRHEDVNEAITSLIKLEDAAPPKNSS
ncbi:uncharacterized protein PV06_10803 [Exophiala oligosperma]|uniref:Uncharacterized protein n=2 Tax=Chaetothyriales TaxID=34395 RepID=A0A0D2D4C1_9EURO|nr:uncharacterized protein PV06_10803 [Exophiala oligosperma]KAJ9619417.1 hypothetical protein H2204_012693 [Knufia peltigerae]KIW37185.1 hypothetical protein PV06_10803 [Exophiala oligosperma]